MRRTKIVATIGPSCNDPATLTKMIEAGMDVVRLNYSHGTHEAHETVYEAVREAEARAGRAIAVLQDLQGVKVRVGALEGGQATLKAGSTVEVRATPGGGDATGFSVDDPALVAGLAPGTPLLLGDGEVALEVIEATKGRATARVVHGGPIRQGAGIMAPGAPLAGGLTQKDQQDLLHGREMGVDAVALSFVGSASDVADAREFLAAKGEQTPLIAKIERTDALADLAPIASIADGLLVARGDLGIALPPEEVPLAQKRIIQTAGERGRISITATQMLESMITKPRPTRAEASDVANAIIDGTHAVMLSAETAVGEHPVAAVRVMAAIAQRVDLALATGELARAHRPPTTSPTISDAISHAAAQSADQLGAAAVLAFTQSGASAIEVAKHRPATPIVAPSPDLDTRRHLALVWGVHPIEVPAARTMDEQVHLAETAAKAHGLVQPGDLVAMVAGEIGVTGSTNLLRMMHVR